MVNSIYNNFYFNKESKKWSNDKYRKILNKVSKGKSIKSFNYYYQTNLQTEDISMLGYYSLYTGSKIIKKIFVNVTFKKNIDNYIVIIIYYSDKNNNYLELIFK